MAVFGLFVVDWLLLIHLRAAGRPFSPPHRAHVASTRGTIRDTEVQGLDIAIDSRSLLFGVHIRGLLMGDGAVEVNCGGGPWRLSLGACCRSRGRGLVLFRSLNSRSSAHRRVHFGCIDVQQAVELFPSTF